MEIYTYLFGLLGAIILYILRRKGVTLDTFPTIMCKKEQAEISNLDEQIRSKSSKLGISKD
jgi:hypothetical protein